MKNKLFVNVTSAKNRPDYAAELESIKEAGICPFCPDNVKKYLSKIIYREGRHWLIADATYPYKNAKYHFILVHHAHIENASDISEEGWSELKEFVDWICGLKQIKGATLIMRFGDTNCTGASVTHLHASLVSGDGDQKDREPVLTRVG